MSATPTILKGQLNSDGTIKLETVPELSPGPVQVTIQPLPRPETRLPDLPWEDENVPAPFDLPRPQNAKRVTPRQIAERLQDSFE